MGVGEGLEEYIDCHRLGSQVRPRGRCHKGLEGVMVDVMIDVFWLQFSAGRDGSAV